MDKNEIIAFFDRCAPDWDKNMIRNDDIIAAILDNGGVVAGTEVLDVACGTGVLFPDYLARGVARVVGVDISPEMIRIANEKFSQANISFICGDVEEVKFDRLFDCVMLYNAIPHFTDPANLMSSLAECLKPGGRLSVAHGMSREKIDHHHSGTASKISMGLMPETELAGMLRPYFDVDVIISNDHMYQVSGVKK